VTPGAEARDGQGAAGGREQAPAHRPRRLQDRVEPSGSDDDEDIDDEGEDREDDDTEDRAEIRASSDIQDEDGEDEDGEDDDEDDAEDGDEDDEDSEDSEDEDEDDAEDEDDSGKFEAAAARTRVRGSDEHDREERERARQRAAFLRGADRHDAAAVPQAIDPSDSDLEEEPGGAWSADEVAGAAGDDDHLPALPVPEHAHYEEPPNDDPDPVTWILDQSDEEPEERALDRPVYNVVGIKFASAGRIYLYDAGEEDYARGEEVVVDTERGTRTGTVAVTAVRKVHSRGEVRPVLRRPSVNDRRTAERNDERCREALQIARDIVRDLALPMKVFRTEYGQSGKKATIYFTSEERVDFRDLVRDLSKRLHCRVEMRQTGVRDEAKQVGGIGSCGRELCCTTWLPEFVPVSIKMAKDQGLVLNPTKVSGQCGRLKCCLVYEQETYAALRKGLPKLGKRVLVEEGEEGRVVEVDVLRQRVRVALAPGEFRVVEASQIKPMFPSQGPKPGRPGERPPPK
jgi:cell fate regulator YaaT (PSP1 superfamily)